MKNNCKTETYFRLSKILSIINKEVWGQCCDIYIFYCVLTFVLFCFRFGVGSSGFGLVLLFIHILKNKLLNWPKFDCNINLSFPLWSVKMGLGLTGQHCKFCLHVSACLYSTVQIPGATLALVIVISLPVKLAFTISAPVNEGMSNWFICTHILKQDIADITEDYTDSIVFSCDEQLKKWRSHSVRTFVRNLFVFSS